MNGNTQRREKHSINAITKSSLLIFPSFIAGAIIWFVQTASYQIEETKTTTKIRHLASCAPPSDLFPFITDLVDYAIDFSSAAIATVFPPSWILLDEQLGGGCGTVSLSSDGNTLAQINNIGVYVTTLQPKSEQVLPGCGCYCTSFEMSLDGLSIIIGNPDEDKVTVFEKGHNMVWTQVGSTLNKSESYEPWDDYYEYEDKSHSFGSSVSISDDGQRIAMSTGRDVFYAYVQVYERSNDEWILLSNVTDISRGLVTTSVSISGDGLTMAIAAASITIYDVDDTENPIQNLGWVHSPLMEFSSDGNIMLVADGHCDYHYTIYKRIGNLYQQLGDPVVWDTLSFGDVSLLSTGTFLAVGKHRTHSTGKVYIYSIETDSWELSTVLQGWALEIEDFISGVALSRQGSRIAISSSSRTMIYDFI